MAKLTPAQLYKLARDAGLGPAQAITAAAIALAESGGDPAAVGDVGIQTDKWGPSLGLWQIRSLKADYGTGRARDGARLHDPAFNARSMAEISGTGGNWRPWSVFTSGSYQKRIPEVTADVGGAKSGPITDVDSGGIWGDVADAVEDAVPDPFAVFAGWQSDLHGLVVKLGFGIAGVWLTVAGIKAAVGGGDG